MTDYEEALQILWIMEENVLLMDYTPIGEQRVSRALSVSIKAVKLAQAVEKDIAAGFVMVPSEVTEDMLLAAIPRGYTTDSGWGKTLRIDYGDVIAAAPKSNIAREMEDEQARLK